MLFKTLVLTAAFFAPVILAVPDVNLASVNLRIEGKHQTIFDGEVLTEGHNVTTASGGNHHCDGTNHGASTTPGPTVTGALDTAAQSYGFKWDGNFSTKYDDFLITSIDGQTQTSTEFWGALLNLELIKDGGCQQKVIDSDEVLWAFDAFNKAHFLKLFGPKVVHVNKAATFTVIDGKTGSPVAGAVAHGQKSDANGHISVTFTVLGEQKIKAEKVDSIRSNSHVTTVVP